MTTSNTSISVADVLAIDETVQRTTSSAPYGITQSGFFAKPFARLLAEKLALARLLFGAEVDLTAGSAIRKLVEITALEEARTWAALNVMYDNSFISTAAGDALTRLGEELGLSRPFLEASGSVKLTLAGKLPVGMTQLVIPRGARMLTKGGHHAALGETVTLSPASPTREAAVVAFYPGPDHNLDPGQPGQKIELWNCADPQVEALCQAAEGAGAPLVTIEHTAPLTGGNLRWADDRYRQLLLNAPRSLWTADSVMLAVSLVPGVRQVQVYDGLGGLDINQSIFGNFNFIERVFSSERNLGSPYYFTVLVAPAEAAIWEGPDGLRLAVESTIEDLRPISIFPSVEKADEIGVGIKAEILVRGIPLPAGPNQAVNLSEPALALKARLLKRVHAYISTLQFGEPVRSAEVVWALMSEPGVADVRNLQLLRYPPSFDTVVLSQPPNATQPQELLCGENLELQANQIAVLVEDASRLKII